MAVQTKASLSNRRRLGRAITVRRLIKLPEIGAIDQGNRAKRHREDAACAFVLLASQTQAPARMAPIRED
jgi:hypothetical protein